MLFFQAPHTVDLKGHLMKRVSHHASLELAIPRILAAPRKRFSFTTVLIQLLSLFWCLKKQLRSPLAKRSKDSIGMADILRRCGDSIRRKAPKGGKTSKPKKIALALICFWVSKRIQIQLLLLEQKIMLFLSCQTVHTSAGKHSFGTI